MNHLQLNHLQPDRPFAAIRQSFELIIPTQKNFRRFLNLIHSYKRLNQEKTENPIIGGDGLLTLKSGVDFNYLTTIYLKLTLK